MAAILNILIYQPQLQFDLKCETIIPNYAEKVCFMVMTSSMTSQGDLKFALYIHVEEMLSPGAICKGKVSSINANIVIVVLGDTCLNKISINNIFDIAGPRSTLQGLLGDLGT